MEISEAGLGEESRRRIGSEELPEYLIAVEGSLDIESDDETVARAAWDGFKYTFYCEFARRLPGFALLYDIEIVNPRVRRASTHYIFKFLVRLKRRVVAEIRKAGVIGTLVATLGIATATVELLEAYRGMTKDAAGLVQKQIPSCQINVQVFDVRIPDDRDIFDTKRSRDFEL